MNKEHMSSRQTPHQLKKNKIKSVCKVNFSQKSSYDLSGLLKILECNVILLSKNQKYCTYLQKQTVHFYMTPIHIL